MAVIYRRPDRPLVTSRWISVTTDMMLFRNWYDAVRRYRRLIVEDFAERSGISFGYAKTVMQQHLAMAILAEAAEDGLVRAMLEGTLKGIEGIEEPR